LIWVGRRLPFGARPHIFLILSILLVLLQVTLGIAVLLFGVPLSLAVMHQGVAFVLFGVAIAYVADMRQLAVI
jgi:cytochrome c oxidase assembly protein subunit 15